MSKEARLEKMNEELRQAIHSEDTDKVRKLLKKGADANARGEYGGTPLSSAVYVRNIEISALLIDHGADVNFREDVLGKTLLHQAVERGSSLMVDLLIARGANIEARDKEGNTPLLTAASNMSMDLTGPIRADIVLLLLNRGADVNARDNGGGTPLRRVMPPPPFKPPAGADRVAALLVERGGVE